MKPWWTALSALVVSGTLLSAADWYVTTTGDDLMGDGSSGNPYATIGVAIGAASDNDVIHVGPGTFNESDLFVDKSVTIRGAGMGATTVDAGFAGIVFFLYGATKTIAIEDLTMANGAGHDGGGLLCVAATGTVSRCEVTQCYSQLYGGGVRNHYGELWLRQCRLTGNEAHFLGGGAYNAKLDSCLVTYNVATNGGGAAECELYNCTIYTNFAQAAGGTWRGKAFNSIVTFNVGTTENDQNYVDTVFRDSCAHPLPSGAGNIAGSPVLLDPDVVANDDFREFVTSPCINRGNPDYVLSAVDLFGANRQYDGLPDMGASEFTLYSVPARIPSFSGPTDFGSVQVGSSVTQTVYLANKGNTVLTVSGFTATTGFAATMADVTVNPGESNGVAVSFTPVHDGTYAGSLVLLSDATWGESGIVLSGEGLPAPALAVSPASVSAASRVGANPAGVSLQVRNAGPGTMAFTVAADQPWAVPAPASGSSSGTNVSVQLDFNVLALSAGSYSATVTVSAASATNSPVRVPVTVTLTDPPSLEVSTAALTAACPAGANATAQVFQVRNAGPGVLAFTVRPDDGEWEPLAPGGGSWLTAEPQGGSSTGDWVTVAVRYDAAGLPNGVYTGFVRVLAEGAAGSPADVAVRLTVGTPYIPVSLASADWHVAVTGSDTAGDGSAGNPYATIAKAVAMASDGQVIQVATGLYIQAGIPIDKSLTIRGMGWNATIVQPPLGTDQEWEKRIFFANGMGVTASIENMWLRNGYAHGGSALLAVGATVTVSRCRMSGNAATLDGGGAVRSLNGSVLLSQCILDRNTSTTDGGATYGCDLDNGLVVFNTAAAGGAAVTAGRVSTCTVAHNTGLGVKGGAVSNSIVVFNTAGNLSETETACTMSDTAAEGEGNSAGDPLFEAATNGHFHLDLVSPALNAEAPSEGQPALDLYGRPRLVGLLLDLGPLEKQYVVPVRRIRLAGSLAFGELGVGLTAVRTLWVINTGNTNLNVLSIETPDGFTAAPQAFPVAPGASNAVTVTFAPDFEGAFGGDVTVFSDAQNDPVSVESSGSGWYPPPGLEVDPLVVNVTVVEGQNASNEYVTVRNSASAGVMAFTVASDSGWVTPVPLSGSSTGDAVTVTLAFHTDDLLYGFYTGAVTVSAAEATNGSAAVDVRLTVLPGQVPAKPVPLAPAQGDDAAMTNALAFVWSEAARAEQYHVWIGTNGVFFTNAWTTGEDATNMTIMAPFRRGTYLWMVAGSNWLGYGPWSTTVTFTVYREMWPSGGVILPIGTIPEFQWTETPGATQYELDVQRYDPASGAWSAYLNQSAPAPAGTWLAGASFAKGSYRWRLRERVDGTWTDWDDWACFQLALPASPQPVRPTGIGYLWKSVLFRWTGATGATAYQIEIRSGGVRYYLGSWQSGVKLTVGLKSRPATYWWRVRARNGAGVGAWSPLVKFVRKALPKPVGTVPSGGVNLPYGSLTTFEWAPLAGASKYEIALWHGADFLASYKLFGADSRTYTASLPLDHGAYTWKVRGGNSDGWGPWSAPAALNIQ